MISQYFMTYMKSYKFNILEYTNSWGKFEENLTGMGDIFSFFWIMWYGITYT